MEKRGGGVFPFERVAFLFFIVWRGEGRFHMSMMEIYNETVFDLLRAEGTSKKSLDIRQSAGGGTSVPGLTEVRARCIRDRHQSYHNSSIVQRYTSSFLKSISSI